MLTRGAMWGGRQMLSQKSLGNKIHNYKRAFIRRLILVDSELRNYQIIGKSILIIRKFFWKGCTNGVLLRNFGESTGIWFLFILEALKIFNCLNLPSFTCSLVLQYTITTIERHSINPYFLFSLWCRTSNIRVAERCATGDGCSHLTT